MPKPAQKGARRVSGDEAKCVDILLNYACSAKCLFCSQDPAGRGRHAGLPRAAALRQMYLAYDQGYRRLGFTGGEPTLRPDLAPLISSARKIGYTYIRIQTNGLRLAEPGYARSLAEAGLTFVKFSLHGHRAELHDRLVGVPGAFVKCLRAIDNLKDLRVGMGVNFVLNKWNHEHIEEFFQEFLIKRQLSNFVIIAPLYEGNMARNARAIGVKMSQAAPYVRKAFALCKKVGYPKPPLLLNFTPCILPGYESEMLGWSNFNTIVVSPDGKAHDLDKSVQAHTIKGRGCSCCVYNRRCIGVDRSYADFFGLQELVPLRRLPVPAGREAWAAGPRDARVLTDNEQCVLEVLKIRNPAATREFLEIAGSIAACKDCRDENAVIVAAEALIRLGRVRRRFRKGQYEWSLG